MKSVERKSITVVGGGSAGWMTAIYLNKLFNHDNKNYDITVIESPDIGVIGVGEATVHSVRFFFQAMGLDERELLAETNATLKLGIMFRNWMKPMGDKTHEYFHPFEHQRLGELSDISSSWFLNGRDKIERYDEGVCLSAGLIREGRSPKSEHSQPYQGVVPYGYHIDAVLMGRFLRRKAIEAGVVHVAATVKDVLIEDGNILSVETEDASYEADTFIDCTGFRGLLIDKLREDNWDSFTDALPCNKAVAIQRELPKGHTPNPYTVATAQSNGWIWQIDLVNRQGTGYVYDGNRISAEQAEQELRDFLGDESKILKSTHLDMKVGCRKEFWVGNCIAVGLAGGFIEPLESTGLHLIHLGAGLLATHLPTKETSQVLRDSYNRLMSGFYQDLKQFIVLHYCLSDRDDSEFWQSAAATVKHCPKLESHLAVWKHKICEYHDLAGSYATTFSDENYRYILYGMQHYPSLNLPFAAENGDLVFGQLKRLSDRAIASTLPHADYLRQLNQ